jgi:8-oxo-dGTP pyrophosphatase MutT (NUDIX family)
MSSDEAFRELSSETVFAGRFFDVRVERFRQSDGEEVSRESVRHLGVVAILAHDQDHVWLVRQPRETVREPHLLEIPAGRLDIPGEKPLEAAQRELAEEVSLGAGDWENIISYYSSPGFTDELVHLFLATDLREAHAESDENERIEVVKWPIDQLGGALAECRDAKTIIALQWLARRLGC